MAATADWRDFRNDITIFCAPLLSVIAGLDPAIHTDCRHPPRFIMDARVKPEHDSRA
jgi:hypothetical protein